MPLRLPVRSVQVAPALVVSYTVETPATKARIQSVGSSTMSRTVPPGKFAAVGARLGPAVVRRYTVEPTPT